MGVSMGVYFWVSIGQKQLSPYLHAYAHASSDMGLFAGPEHAECLDA